MIEWVPVIVSVAAFVVAAITAAINGGVSLRRECRDDVAATIEHKNERIDELEQKVSRLVNDVDALAAKVRLLERRLDQYGCWNAPECKDWRPLSTSQAT